ncbi:hypothetical protein PMIN07_012231 [Paraphaeosphaeria minitans]
MPSFMSQIQERLLSPFFPFMMASLACSAPTSAALIRRYVSTARNSILKASVEGEPNLKRSPLLLHHGGKRFRVNVSSSPGLAANILPHQLKFRMTSLYDGAVTWPKLSPRRIL